MAMNYHKSYRDKVKKLYGKKKMGYKTGHKTSHGSHNPYTALRGK